MSDYNPLECPTTCGHVETIYNRSVLCLSDTGIESEALCDDIKPETERTCPATEECPIWVITEDYVSECPTVCDSPETIQTRTVIYFFRILTIFDFDHFRCF